MRGAGTPQIQPFGREPRIAHSRGPEPVPEDLRARIAHSRDPDDAPRDRPERLQPLPVKYSRHSSLRRRGTRPPRATMARRTRSTVLAGSR